MNEYYYYLFISLNFFSGPVTSQTQSKELNAETLKFTDSEAKIITFPFSAPYRQLLLRHLTSVINNRFASNSLSWSRLNLGYFQET